MIRLAGAVAGLWRGLEMAGLRVAVALVFLIPAAGLWGQGALTATSTTLSVSNAAPGYGTMVVLSAAITPATATGKVYFYNGTTLVGMGIVRSGLALFPTATLPIGSNSITAQYLGDKSNAASASVATTVAVSQTTTTVQLTSSAALVSVGDVIKLQASVAPKWGTGTVNFLSGTNQIASCTLLGGKCTGLWTTASTDIGSDAITAVYLGDTIYNTSTSAALSITVRGVSSTVLTASNANPNYGDSETLTATVTPATATGSVRFLDGAKLLGTGTLSGGVATLTTTALSTGSHSLTAAYTGDTGDGKSTSAVVPVVVSGLTTTTTLTASKTTSNYGDLVTLSAAVTPTAAPGKVSFYNDSVQIGIGVLHNGTAILPWSTLPVGSNSITAQYVTSANYQTSSSSAVTVTVSQATPGLTLSSSTSKIVAGKSITLTAQFSASSVVDTISFADAGAVIGTAVLRGGKAVLVVPGITAGSHSYTAIYAGSTNYAAVTSAAVAVTGTTTASKKSTAGAAISQAVQLSLGEGSLRVAESSTLVATVAQPTSSGTVSFFADGRLMGEVAFSNGRAELPVNWKRAGAVSLVARYNGAANSVAAKSTAISANVARAATTDLCSTLNAAGDATTRALRKYLSGSSGDADAALVGIGEDENLLCAANAGSAVTVDAPEFTASGRVSSARDAAENGVGAAIVAKGQDEATGAGGRVSIVGGAVESVNPNVDALFATMGGEIAAKALRLITRGDGSAAVAVSHAGQVTGRELRVASEGTAPALRLGIAGGRVELAESQISAANAAVAEIADGGRLKMSGGSLRSAGEAGAAVSFVNPLAGAVLGSGFTMEGGRMLLDGDAGLAKSWFAAKGASAEIRLADVSLEATGSTATTRLLKAESQTVQGIDGAAVRGSVVHLVAVGSGLSGDVVTDPQSAAHLELSKDAAGKGAHWVGAASGVVTLKLDRLSQWTVTGDTQLGSLIDEDASYGNIVCAEAGCRVSVGGRVLAIH